jgi:hypothetical protein
VLTFSFFPFFFFIFEKNSLFHKIIEKNIASKYNTLDKNETFLYLRTLGLKIDEEIFFAKQCTSSFASLLICPLQTMCGDHLA